MPLTPQGFVSKWKRAEARERQSVQEHFIDLCSLIGQVPPMQADPTGQQFAFEMGLIKTSGRSRCFFSHSFAFCKQQLNFRPPNSITTLRTWIGLYSDQAFTANHFVDCRHRASQ
jgi:hypothetical protein